MKIGIVFPQNEIGSDPAAIRGFAQAAEEIGLTHIAAFDHVLGADTARRADVPAFYTHQSAFHEPFVLFSHLAAVTSRIGFATCILVLPQRQTALVAKQAAALDLLSGGRLRLGVGIGWNPAEYQSLGEDFATRGKRITEQIAVLRAVDPRHCRFRRRLAHAGRGGPQPAAGTAPDTRLARRHGGARHPPGRGACRRALTAIVGACCSRTETQPA